MTGKKILEVIQH